MAEDIDKAQLAVKAFEIDYAAKYPKAVAKIVDDLDVLLEFFTYLQSTGSIYAPRIRSSPRSRPCGCVRRSPRGRVPARPESPWPTS